MPRGSKDSYPGKQKRQAEHIEKGCEDRGVSKDAANGARGVRSTNIRRRQEKRFRSGRDPEQVTGPNRGRNGQAAMTRPRSEAAHRLPGEVGSRTSSGTRRVRRRTTTAQGTPSAGRAALAPAGLVMDSPGLVLARGLQSITQSVASYRQLDSGHAATRKHQQRKPVDRQLPGEIIMSIGTILLIILILVVIGALPTWGYSSGWGYGPSGIAGVVVIILIILLLTGRL